MVSATTVVPAEEGHSQPTFALPITNFFVILIIFMIKESGFLDGSKAILWVGRVN